MDSYIMPLINGLAIAVIILGFNSIKNINEIKKNKQLINHLQAQMNALRDDVKS